MNTMTIHQAICSRCHIHSDIEIPVDAYSAYIKGAKVQDAFPFLSPAVRELHFMSPKLCGTCWDTLMGDK